MHIAICGLTSNAFPLFSCVTRHLRSLGHTVAFMEPEYSGGVCLMNEGWEYQSSRSVSMNKRPEGAIDIESLLRYDFAVVDLENNDTHKREKQKVKLLARAKEQFQFYVERFNEEKIELVILWAGVKMNSALAAGAARHLRVRTCFIEKGLYPRSLQVDQAGVNARSSWRDRLLASDSAQPLQPLEYFQSLLAKEWSFRQPLQSVGKLAKVRYFLRERQFAALSEKIYDSLVSFQRRRLFKSQSEWKLNDPKGESTRTSVAELGYVFLPLQVSDDAQILCHGGWISGNKMLMEVVASAAMSVDPGLQVVVKPHPTEYRNLDYKSVADMYPNVLWSEDGTLELIRSAALVVTINSTVGFEALLFQKPVIVLGDAAYADAGLVGKARDVNELMHAMRKLRNTLVDRLRAGELAQMVYDLMVPCNFADPRQIEIEELWRRIEGLPTI